jgi:hypothetical protein
MTTDPVSVRIYPVTARVSFYNSSYRYAFRMQECFNLGLSQDSDLSHFLVG